MTQIRKGFSPILRCTFLPSQQDQRHGFLSEILALSAIYHCVKGRGALCM